MYKKFADEIRIKKDGSTETIVVQAISRKADNAVIPFDPANTDYQEYLEWVAEGNTADPAD